MARPEVAVKIAVDDRPAVEGLRRFTATVKRNAVAINAAIEIAGRAWGALTGAIGAATGAAADYVKLAAEQDRVERKLLAAVRTRTEFTEAQFAALQRLNGEVQQATGIGDEAQLALQAELALRGVAVDQLGQATKATIGLAQATGQDLAAAGATVARVYQGQTSALKRYGIEAASTGEAIQALARNYEVAADAANTLAGQAKIADANVGDLRETLGLAIVRSGAAVEALRAVNGVILDVIATLSSSDGQAAVNRFFGGIAEGAANAIEALVGASKALDVLRGRSSQAEQRERAFQAQVGAGLSPEVARGIVEREFPRTAREILETFADQLRVAARTGVVAPGSAGGTGGRPPPRSRPPSGAAGSGGGQPLGVLGDTNLNMGAAVGLGIQRSQQLEAELAAQRAAHEAHAEQLRAQFDAELELYFERSNAIDDLLGSTAQVATAGLAATISGMVQAAVAGEADLGAVLGRLVGGVISQLGTMLIQLGTAGILAGTLGTLIPVFAGLTGGPLGVAAGAATVAAGVGMVALGAGLGAAGGSSSRGSSRSGGGRSSGAPNRIVRPADVAGGASGGFRGSAGEATSTTIVVDFSRARGVILGRPTDVARAIQDTLDTRARRLVPGVS